MCEFFSCVVTRTGDLFFYEDDSHEEIIRRAGLPDTDQYVRHWVRVEVRPQGVGWGPVRVDETTIPGWWTEDAAAWEGKVLDLADRVRQAWEAYQAAIRPAWEAYEAAVRQARPYDEVERQAWDAFRALDRPVWEAYAAALSHIAGYLPIATAAGRPSGTNNGEHHG